MTPQADSTGQVFGIIGDPVAHSASPPMHEAAYRKLGIKAVYKRFHVKPDALKSSLETLKSTGVSGINVTIPHKEAVMPLLDEIDPFAASMGAVNTIVFKDGKSIGYNTDAPGFLMAVASQLQLNWSQESVVILGAGGSAKAISTVLAQATPQSLSIVNRSIDKAQHLAQALSHNTSQAISALSTQSPELESVICTATVIINTTSVGMGDLAGQSPIPHATWLQPHHRVIDIIYTPKETQLLVDAKQAGAKTVNGLSMLAGQGALAFEHFTGQKISSAFMLAELEKVAL